MKPTCPTAAGDMRVPHDDVGSIVSHPSARELPGTVVFRTNLATRDAVAVQLGARAADGFQCDQFSSEIADARLPP